MYQGIPLPERSSLDPPLLPDKITIFAEPLLEDFPDPEELREEIRSRCCTKSPTTSAWTKKRSKIWATEEYLSIDDRDAAGQSQSQSHVPP